MSDAAFQRQLADAMRAQLLKRGGEIPDIDVDAAVTAALGVTNEAFEQRLTDAIRERVTDRGELPDVDELAEQAVAAAADRRGPQPEFASLWDFVSQWLLPTYRRISDHPNFAWCPEWWRHPEVVVRLDALWRSWEHLRREPGTGMSVWLKDHLDHHMPVLLSQDGPMHRCKPTGHHERALEPIPSDTPPASWITGDIAA